MLYIALSKNKNLKLEHIWEFIDNIYQDFNACVSQFVLSGWELTQEISSFAETACPHAEVAVVSVKT